MAFNLGNKIAKWACYLTSDSRQIVEVKWGNIDKCMGQRIQNFRILLIHGIVIKTERKRSVVFLFSK